MPGARPAAIIDVGSNSVRLVVYDGNDRAPRPLFNEKAMCGLGRDIDQTGRLNPTGKALALAALRRFAMLLDAMDVEFLDAVATAAVRDAADGMEFLAELANETGISVRLLTGPEESRISAAGVLSAIPDANGLAGDLGGGSLELMRVDGSNVDTGISLPLGVLRLMDGGVASPNLDKIIAEQLGGQSILDDVAGRALYVVGGAWRALGRLHMESTGHPLDILHGYRADAASLSGLCRVVAEQSPGSLRALRSVSSARVATLPAAALLLVELLRRTAISSVVFSAYGLREGLLLERQSGQMKRQDPLLAACRDVAGRSPRSPLDDETFMAWLLPLFGDEDAQLVRLRRAAILLSETAWRVHPDYRARQAMADVIRGQFVGIDHRERVMLGLALWARYSHKNITEAAEPYRAVLHEMDVNWSYRVGLALRLAHSLSGGYPELLKKFQVELRGGNLVLRNLPGAPEPNESVIAGRLRNLAEAFGCQPLFISAG